jgi:hypothetical protein
MNEVTQTPLAGGNSPAFVSFGERLLINVYLGPSGTRHKDTGNRRHPGEAKGAEGSRGKAGAFEDRSAVPRLGAEVGRAKGSAFMCAWAGIEQRII